MFIYKSSSMTIQPEGAGSATVIGGITSQSIALGSDHMAEPTAGATRAQHSEINNIQPRGNVTTFLVSDLLQLIGTEGACLAGGTAEGFSLWQMRTEPCGTTSTGSVHRKIVLPNGIIVPRSLSCSHRENASITAEVISTFDGTNDPVIVVPGLPAPSVPTDDKRFTLGPITLSDGSTTFAMNDVLNVDINFGIEVQSEGANSDIFDSNLQILQVKPEITITTRNVEVFGSNGLPLRGIHATHANSQIILRKRVNATGDFSADADSIAITFDGLVSVDNGLTAQGNQRGQSTVKITCLDDLTNAPLVFDFAHDLVP